LVVPKNFIDLLGLVLEKSFFYMCVFCDQTPAKLKKSTFFLFFLIKGIGKKIKKQVKIKILLKKVLFGSFKKFS
jgi:hypothetical protein